MDSRLIRNCLLLFAIAYAQTTPLFVVYGIKADVALVLAVFLSLSAATTRERVILSLCASFGFASGIGLLQALLFFFAVFFSAYGVQRILPWRPFFSACALVLFFSALSYVSLDWGLLARYAPQFARETLYNAITLIVFYAFIPYYHARHGRY